MPDLETVLQWHVLQTPNVLTNRSFLAAAFSTSFVYLRIAVTPVKHLDGNLCEHCHHVQVCLSCLPLLWPCGN